MLTKYHYEYIPIARDSFEKLAKLHAFELTWTAQPGANHPATFGLPDRWIWSDEWYEFSNPHGVTIHPVLTVDERTYDPTKIWPDQAAKGMGADHPVSWWHTYEKGRVFVTTLGTTGRCTARGGIWITCGVGCGGRRRVWASSQSSNRQHFRGHFPGDFPGARRLPVHPRR
jgi:hypothetical protein